MTSVEKLYNLLTAEERQLFWRELNFALLYRGMDAGGVLPRHYPSHADNFIKLVGDLCCLHGMEIVYHCTKGHCWWQDGDNDATSGFVDIAGTCYCLRCLEGFLQTICGIVTDNHDTLNPPVQEEMVVD